MDENRRNIMRTVGVALASLVSVSCGLVDNAIGGILNGGKNKTATSEKKPKKTNTPAITCYTFVPITGTPTITATVTIDSSTVIDMKDKNWQRLRQLWLDLPKLAKTSTDLNKGEKLRDQMIASHQTTLTKLADTGKLDEALVDELQTAYSSAAWHVWRSNAPITCYVPVPGPDYIVRSYADLNAQATMLMEMAEAADIEEGTVMKAQESIERDIAFMTLSQAEQSNFEQKMIEQYGNDESKYLELSELDLNIPPDCQEATLLLVRLLLKGEYPEA